MHCPIFLMWLEQLIPQKGGGNEERNEATAELPLWGVKSGLAWRDGLCCVGINVGSRLQSHVHDGISNSEKCFWHIFFPAHAEYWANIESFVCFFPTHCLKASHQGLVGWESLWNRGRSGRPDLSVCKCIQVNYLLLSPAGNEEG